MAKFKFRFASILKLRKSREEDALRALGAAQRAYQVEVDKRAKLVRDLEASLVRREGLGSQPIGILAFQLEQDFITGTKKRISQAERDITRAGRTVEKALRAYLHARRQTKMMELLYEKEFKEYKKTAMKREQKFLDDLMIMRQRLKEQVA